MKLNFQSIEMMKYLTFQRREHRAKKEKKLAKKCDLFSYPKTPLLSSSWINQLVDIVITCYRGDVHIKPL